MIDLSLLVIDSFKKIESKCHEPSVHGIFVVTIFHMATNLTTEMKMSRFFKREVSNKYLNLNK